MKVISLTDNLRLAGSYAATIGFFDGVHTGHRYVIEQLRKLGVAHGWPSMAITFDRHPRQVVQSDWHPLLLTTLEEKSQLLAATGIDVLAVLPFDERMAALTARDFMLHVLKERLGVRLLLTGYDNHFGHRTAASSEGFDDYVRYGKDMGIDVVCGEGLMAPRQQDGRTFVSSSLIRRMLGAGLVEEAAQCLGRCYSLKGTVVHGYEQGRKMGFPTANMQVDESRLVPANGVYAVRVSLAAPSFQAPLHGITNVGIRPTFDGHRRTIETHILDFSGDVYGQDISIEFVARLRDEHHFESPDELAGQMVRDAVMAERVLKAKD